MVGQWLRTCLATWAMQVQVNPTENSASILQILELTPKKDVLFIKGDWNTKVGSQEIPGLMGKFGLGVQNEARQRLIRVLPRKRTGHSKHPLPTTQ